MAPGRTKGQNDHFEKGTDSCHRSLTVLMMVLPQVVAECWCHYDTWHSAWECRKLKQRRPQSTVSVWNWARAETKTKASKVRAATRAQAEAGDEARPNPCRGDSAFGSFRINSQREFPHTVQFWYPVERVCREGWRTEERAVKINKCEGIDKLGCTRGIIAILLSVIFALSLQSINESDHWRSSSVVKGSLKLSMKELYYLNIYV